MGAGGKDICGDKKFSGVRRRTVLYRRTRRRRDRNGLGRFDRRPERSRGGAGTAGWGMGRDSASSAQSKRVGTGVEQGGTRLEGGGTGDGGRETVTAGGSGTAADVKGEIGRAHV